MPFVDVETGENIDYIIQQRALYIIIMVMLFLCVCVSVCYLGEKYPFMFDLFSVLLLYCAFYPLCLCIMMMALKTRRE